VANRTTAERVATRRTDRTASRARDSDASRDQARIELDAQRKARYLRAIEQAGTLAAGCRAARVSHNTVYAWREVDDVFAMAENQARSTFADALEEAAVRRARDGIERPVYQQGTLVGYETVYSDALLWNLLKATRPEKFRERLDMNVSSVVKQIAGFAPEDVL